MRESELELIAALAEGSLEDETEARALVESSDEHRAEYEAQKLAIELLRGAGTVLFTDSERAALRRDVWTALSTDEPAQRTSTPWYYRWSPVAAGLVVVVGLVAVLSQAGEGDSAPVFDAAAPTTTAAAAAPGDDAQGGAVDEGSVTTSEDDAGDGESALYDLAAARARLAEEAEKVRSGDFAGAGLETSEEEFVAVELEGCVADAGYPDYRVLGTIANPADTTDEDSGTRLEEASVLIAAIPEGAELSEATVAFVDRITCELIHLDE